MNSGNPFTVPAAPAIDELRIMTFSMMGIRMGVEARQVSRMLEPGQATPELRVVHLHENLSFGDRSIRYRSPHILLLRGEETVAVMIDQPEDIVVVKLDSIRPLPLVFAAHMRSAIVWGVALIEEQIVLLVDLFKLAAGSRLLEDLLQEKSCRQQTRTAEKVYLL